MDFFTGLSNFISSNPLLSTLIGVGGAGMLTFWVKDVPKTVAAFLKKQLTTTLSVSNYNKSFYDVLSWISKKYPKKNFRTLKLTNGKWGYEEDTTTSIGYGLHLIFFKKRPFVINLGVESGANSERDKELLSITSVGRSRKSIDAFIFEVSKINEDEDKTKLYNMCENTWQYVREQNKRPMSSVFIEEEKKNKF